jgi:hypothetical protein
VALTSPRTSVCWDFAPQAPDNLTRFEGLRGELADAKMGNDVQFTADLALRF